MTALIPPTHGVTTELKGIRLNSLTILQIAKNVCSVLSLQVSPSRSSTDYQSFTCPMFGQENALVGEIVIVRLITIHTILESICYIKLNLIKTGNQIFPTNLSQILSLCPGVCQLVDQSISMNYKSCC